MKEKILNKSYKIIKLKVDCLPKIEDVKVSFKYFYHSFNDVISTFNISIADDILADKLYLFDQLFDMNNKGWLLDPISGETWPENVFFTDAAVEIDGYGDCKYVMEVNKFYHLLILAEGYCHSRNHEYLAHIKDSLESWMVEVPYEKSVVNKSMLDIIYRCYNLMQITLICYEDLWFRGQILPLISTLLIYSERQIRLFSTPKWTKYSTGANHTIGEMAGLISIQQFLHYFVGIDYNKYLEFEYKSLYRALDHIITDKGVYLEQSSNYSRLVTEFLMILDIINEAVGTSKSKMLYRSEYLNKLVAYLDTLAVGDLLPDFGDNDGARALASLQIGNRSIRHIKQYGFERFGNIVPQKSLLCLESGQFIWKDNQLAFFTRCGKHSYLPLGSGSHAHNDILSFLLSYKGKELFVDYGTYLYNSGLEYINKDRSTSNHNTAYVNDVEQASFAGKWKYGSYPRCTIDVDSLDVRQDSFIFSGKVQYESITHYRSFRYFNRCLTITDRVECGASGHIKVNFLIGKAVNAVKYGDVTCILFIGDEKIASIEFTNNVTYAIQPSEYHPHYGNSEETSRILLTDIKSGSDTVVTTIKFN
jgi:Heparinase II/III-like protein.